MPPKKGKIVKACKAMKPYGILDSRVKSALNELLKLYGNQWELIEDENYKVLLDFILEKKPEEDEGAKSQKKKAILHQKPQEIKLPLKRLPPRGCKERASGPVGGSKMALAKAVVESTHEVGQELTDLSSSDFGTDSELEDYEPLVKRSCIKDVKDLLLVCADEYNSQSANSIPQLTETPLKTPKQDVAEIAFLKKLNESTCQCIGDETIMLKPNSTNQHLKKRGRRSESPETCPTVGEAEPDEMVPYKKRAKSTNVPAQNKWKTPVIPIVASGDTLCAENRKDTVCFIEPKVELTMNIAVTENLLYIHHDDSHSKAEEEILTCDNLPDEVPLAVIHPGRYGSVNGRSSDNKENNVKLLEFKSLNAEDKGGGNSDVLQFDIASSSLGEVKLSLICNPSQLSGFRVPSVDKVLEEIEESCKDKDPSFSLVKVMKKLCEHFLEAGKHCADAQYERSTNAAPLFDTSRKFDAQDRGNGKDIYEGFLHPPNELFKYRKFIDVVPQISKYIRLNRLNGLNCAIGFKGKDIGSIFWVRQKNVMAFEGPQHLSQCDTEADQKNYPSLSILKHYSYVDDITRDEERVKIPLIHGNNPDDLPSFFYIPQNIVYDKAHLNFSLARISNKDCCSECFKDCLSSARPCACAQQIGGGFAYKPGGLVKESFLEECISLTQDSAECHYVYSMGCSLERTKNKSKSTSCKGHLARKFIKECWSKCGCSKKCGNRVVQQGISVNLQVFRTPEWKGWGLQTVDDLPKGSFVCEYVGEIITNSERHERNWLTTGNGKCTYKVQLDANWGREHVLKDEEALCLDSMVYGNVARFINHRCCDANLVAIPVEVETPDHHYYHVAFFTKRNVAAMEELTWDYGIDFGEQDDNVKPFKCLCGSTLCRDITC